MIPVENTIVNAVETVHTYDEWVKEYYKRKLGLRFKPQTWLTDLKQHLCGLALTMVGIATPFLLDGDATFSLVALPLGIFLLRTKERVMSF